MKHRKTSFLFLLITVFFWGISFLSIKAVISHIPPMTLGFLRFIIAIFVLWIIKKKVAPNERFHKRDFWLLFLSGFTGVSLYFLMENNGIKLISASEASIIVGSIPIVSMVADRIFLKSRISIIQYLGAFFSVFGVLLLIGLNITITNSLIGYLFMFGAVLCWVGYAFLTKPLFLRYSKISLTFYQTLFGLLGFIPFALAEYKDWTMPNPSGWLNIIYLGIFCSALGYYFYVCALDDLGITISSVFINLIPVVTVIAEILLFGVSLTSIQFLGGALVILGVYLATFGEKNNPKQTANEKIL